MVDASGDIDSGDDVSMEFFEDGRLIYEINDGDKIEIINLVYQVEGDILVTDQPSSPQVNRTKFCFQNKYLCLEYQDSVSRFVRETHA